MRKTPLISPKGCRTLAEDNIPGPNPTRSSRPGGALDLNLSEPPCLGALVVSNPRSLRCQAEIKPKQHCGLPAGATRRRQPTPAPPGGYILPPFARFPVYCRRFDKKRPQKN